MFNLVESCFGKDNDDNICNICLQPKEILDKDHVPPQCTGNTKNYSFRYYFPTKNEQNNLVVTNGVGFRTICKECNNILSRYDTGFSRVYKTIQQSNKEDTVVKITFSPHKFLRGVCGHFLSAKCTHHLSKIDEMLRDAFLNPSNSINPELNMYLFYFPFGQIRVIRDLGFVVPLEDRPMFVYSCMKIWPISIILSDYPFIKQDENNWKKYFKYKPGQEITISFDKSIINPAEWPEEDHNIIRTIGLNSANSIIAWPSVI
jgi:hypothetical protein